MSTKVSIVMPVLNGMPYFEIALESVRKQSLEDIEIIVVDGGSTDGTIEYVEKCCSIDKRIKLLHAQKKSMGYQYNMGIEKATGEYIGFCESDDMLDKYAMEYLFEMANNNNKPDCVKSRFKMFIEKNHKFEIEYDVIPRNRYDLHNKIITIDQLPVLFFRDVNMWNGIYRTDFIRENNIKLNETNGAAFQDTGLVQQVHIMSRATVYGDKTVYYYRRDNDNSSVYKSTTGKFALNEMIYILKFLQGNKKYKDKYFANVLARMFGLFVGMYGKDLYWRTSEKYDEEVIEAQKEVCDFYSSLTFAQRSSIGYMNLLHTYMRDIDAFKCTVKSDYINRAELLSSFWKFIKDKKEVVIFGCGENGISTAASFIKNDYNGKISYCDNSVKERTMLEGIDIYPVDLVVKEKSDAIYIVSHINFFSEMQEQLVELGISKEQIICAPPTSMHESMEINYTNK